MARTRSGSDEAGSARVRQVRPIARVDQDVRWLDVAVDETLLVRGVECACDLTTDRDRPFRLENAVLQDLLEIATSMYRIAI
jgi:hypothetical protein